MTTETEIHTELVTLSSTGGRFRRAAASDPRRGQWWRFLALLIITAIVLIPIGVVVFLAVQPRTIGEGYNYLFGNIAFVLQETRADYWLQNSLLATLSNTVLAVVVAAPGGYVLSRARSKLVSGYSASLFLIQSIPVITIVIPLFFLFAILGLVDTIGGVIIVYVGSTVAVATWMMSAYFDTIPKSLEEAAWIDGASRFGAFLNIVLRNSLPGILSVAIFSFLLSWNDFLIALVFLRSTENYTAPVGILTFFQQFTTDWGGVMGLAVLMMIPPVLIFAFLNRYFSVGGIGGSLAGR
jgi:multiple sugar transport system permease protein